MRRVLSPPTLGLFDRQKSPNGFRRKDKASRTVDPSGVAHSL
jgi:hypothetical protein